MAKFSLCRPRALFCGEVVTLEFVSSLVLSSSSSSSSSSLLLLELSLEFSSSESVLESASSGQ